MRKINSVNHKFYPHQYVSTLRSLTVLRRLLLQTPATAPRGTLSTQPEAVDDFVRNFLVRMGMKKTMQQFQNEWHSLSSSGRIKTSEAGYLPDVVKHNEELSEKTKLLESEVDRYRKSAE